MERQYVKIHALVIKRNNLKTYLKLIMRSENFKDKVTMSPKDDIQKFSVIREYAKSFLQEKILLSLEERRIL